jgi:hypothetical protein
MMDTEDPLRFLTRETALTVTETCLCRAREEPEAWEEDEPYDDGPSWHEHRLVLWEMLSTRPINDWGWPRLWTLLPYCLPKKIQENIYKPAHNELLEDYLETRKYRTRWERRWLNFAFTLRTLLLIADCWRVILMNRLAGLAPERIRQWWSARPRF